MSNTRLRKFGVSVVLAASALFAAVTPAQAVVYVGNFDPNFGGLFPDLGFKGTATFSLPSACTGLTGSFANSAPGCGGGAMQITSASVSFYKAGAPLLILQTLNFTSPGTVFSVTLSTPSEGGVTELTGVTSSFSLGVLGTIAESKIGSTSYEFFLGFSGDRARLGYGLPFPATRTNCNESNSTCGFSINNPIVTFTPAIPEPETYALMLAGLAGLTVVARRRRLT